MDSLDLDLTRRAAGSEYLDAVRSLGLHPDALFWAFDGIEGRFVLVLVTEMLDFKGPLAISELLFQAYNASATPKAVDPFVVRLHSPDQAIIRRFDGFKDPSRFEFHPRPGGERIDQDARVLGVDVGGVRFRAAWVYHFALPAPRGPADLSERWRRFAHNVGRLAA